jgi:hypothetical protein
MLPGIVPGIVGLQAIEHELPPMIRKLVVAAKGAVQRRFEASVVGVLNT